MEEEGSKIHNYVYSNEMVEFVRAANDCCEFLEELKGTQGRAFISDSVRYLSAVYSTFVVTGDTEPVLDSPAESTVTEQEWSTLFQQIAMILGPYNDILRIADEGEFDRSEVVSHTISEDLSDLYQELKDFISIYGRGLDELMNDAGWELKERFAEHWGTKLLRALQALHKLYVSGIDPGEKG